jgi:SAM-dependent methyltransferase
MELSQEQINSFLKQAGPPGYYRWRIATEFLQMPTFLSGCILDVGAQNGAFLERLHADFKVGVDLVEVPISSLAWSRADACLLPFASNTFQHVLAFDIIEHVPEDERVLAEIDRVLVPGGSLWLSTTQSDFFLFPGGPLQRRFESAWGHVRRGYTYEELRAKIPASLQGSLLLWREPAFRYTYVLLKLIHARWPGCAQMMMDWLYQWDVHQAHGRRGHWFARLQKTDL